MRAVIIAIAVVCGVALVIFLLRNRPPLNARSLIKIHEGNCDFSGETLKQHVRQAVADIVKDAGIRNAFIAITSEGRVMFSRGIPENVQQRLRNIVLNS